MAVDKHRTCNAPYNRRDFKDLPSDGIRMGYMQNLNGVHLNGVNLYAVTKKDPPYC